MPDLLTLKSKVNLGCDMCDTCCKYRGDIRITAKNIFEISMYMGVTPLFFLENYTHEIEGLEPERALNSVGKLEECILYDTIGKKCSVNPVKPLQCVVFPLFPENIKNDYFYVTEQCKCKNKKEVTVNEWLNRK